MLCLASAERWRCFKWQQKAGAQKKKQSVNEAIQFVGKEKNGFIYVLCLS